MNQLDIEILRCATAMAMLPDDCELRADARKIAKYYLSQFKEPVIGEPSSTDTVGLTVAEFAENLSFRAKNAIAHFFDDSEDCFPLLRMPRDELLQVRKCGEGTVGEIEARSRDILKLIEKLSATDKPV